MDIHNKLLAIQANLKAPKSQFNKFGNYKYRKAEDILEAVKPLLVEQGCTLVCGDTLEFINGRHYVRSEAVLTAVSDGSSVTTTGYAREEETKKGMDGSQITGASSSYARKYALNGLFCIDDNADSDTTNTGNKKDDIPAQPQLTENLFKKMVAAAAEGRVSKDGREYRQYMIDTFSPAAETIDYFDRCVEDYKSSIGK